MNSVIRKRLRLTPLAIACLLLFLIILGVVSKNIVVNEINYIKETKQKIASYEQIQWEINQGINEDEDQKAILKKQTGTLSHIVLLDLCQFAEDVNMEIVNFYSKHTPIERDFSIREIIYTIIITGEYNNFLELLGLIERASYFIDIQDLYTKEILENKDSMFLITLRTIAID